jgi:hypothetical protein
MVAVTPTLGLATVFDTKVPFHVPVMEGTSTPAMLPLSPPAQPVPVTEYVPVSAVAEPEREALIVCDATAAEVTVAVCPLIMPEMGTEVVGVKQAELITRRAPETLVPVWTTLPPIKKLGPLLEAAAKSQLPDVRASCGTGVGVGAGVLELPPQPESKRQKVTIARQTGRKCFSSVGNGGSKGGKKSLFAIRVHEFTAGRAGQRQEKLITEVIRRGHLRLLPLRTQRSQRKPSPQISQMNAD